MTSLLLQATQAGAYTSIIIGAVLAVIVLFIFIRMYRKAVQGEALVRTGIGGTKVGFSGVLVVPVVHKLEVMDITLKTIVIERRSTEGLICKDNLRADIKVNFYVRVNKTTEDVVHVAQSIGCARASDPQQLELLFDAKFSEALKTVGKQFDFVELYNSRADFRDKMLEEIGTDLNGYILDDAAIDYLEQTSITDLDDQNILDSQGIKKIIELTSAQKIQSNAIEREKEQTIKKQDVEARETVLELERQEAEATAKQRREVDVVRAREEAETEKIREEERLKSEKARISTDEELQVAEQNRERQVIVALKNKERTEAVEAERVEQARQLEETEREKVVELAQIEKEKGLEVERKAIQDVIRERIAVEKAVVEEQERIKDTEAIAEAERNRKTAMIDAERDAEAALVKEIKDAEAKKQASEHKAKQIIIDSEAEQQSSGLRADAIKTLAEAEASKHAALGMAEAQVMEAKASAKEKEGEANASVIEDAAVAEAKGIRVKGEAQSEADEKIGLVRAKVTREEGVAEAEVIRAKATSLEEQGMAEARVDREKYAAEAEGIKQKGESMKALDGVGREHEEFKLRLEQEKEIRLAELNVQKELAEAQALVLAEALKSANIDIVGGETMFFDQISGAITKGKSLDRMVDNSHVMTTIKNTFFDSENGQQFKEKLKSFIDQFGMSSEDVRNLSVSALLLKMMNEADGEDRTMLQRLGGLVEQMGLSTKPVGSLGLL